MTPDAEMPFFTSSPSGTFKVEPDFKPTGYVTIPCSVETKGPGYFVLIIPGNLRVKGMEAFVTATVQGVTNTTRIA